jgi:hypothetical protein
MTIDRRLRRNALTAAVLALWAGMLIEVARRQRAAAPGEAIPLEEAAPADDGRPAVERDEWFDVRHEGRKVGWAHRVLERDGESGWRMREDSSFSLAMLGAPQTVRSSIKARTDGGFALREFEFGIVSPAMRFRASGDTDGKRLRVTYGPEGRESSTDFELAEPIHLPATLRPRVIAGRPAAGTRLTATVFSPLTMRNEPMTIVVEGRETIEGRAGRVETTRIAEEHQGAKVRAWIADDGSVLREEGTLGFVMERSDAASARTGIEQDRPPDLALESRIPFPGEIANPRELGKLEVVLGGAAADLVPSSPPRQTRDGRILRVVRESLPSPAPPRPIADAPADVAEALDPSPFIESDDPAIVGLARSLAGAEKDSVLAARRLVEWVNDHVTQAPSLTIPSAREALRERRGDCNEHAVLLAALGRAAGIPSRVAAGAMYADGAFLYHAWTEFWLGSWVSADAVFRQMPVDATHVKLVEGGPERHGELARIIGRLDFAPAGATR